jgi:hypothetical protein
MSAFVAAAPLPSTVRRSRSRHPRNAPLTAISTPPPSLSVPLPLPSDLFAPQTLTFLHSTLSASDRPELLGTLLWSFGLYGGLSQRVRWGSALREVLNSALPGPPATASAAATALHTLPFLFAAFGIDAGLRAVTGGNSAWAVAAGVTVFLYAGIYEAGRQGAKSKVIDEEENPAFQLFKAFAGRRLERRGRCHLMDVRAAIRSDPSVPFRLRRISDEQLRRFIRTWAPSAVRSPNGYYRELSIRSLRDDDGSIRPPRAPF